LHLLGGEQQLYPIIPAEIFLGLLVAPSRKDDHIFLNSENAHVVAPAADDVRTAISGRNDCHELGCLPDVATNSLDFCHSDFPQPPFLPHFHEIFVRYSIFIIHIRYLIILDQIMV
jgi:hypothetical protein